MSCRHCDNPSIRKVLDLGNAPPSNAYLTQAQLSAPEVTYPLRLYFCDTCGLMQTEDYAAPDELFDENYAYFSSTSSGWLAHAKRFASQMQARFDLGPDSFVVEVASNDGYLLRNFVAAQVPCLGIEPTTSTARAAEAVGVPTLQEFFGEDLAKGLAKDGKRADLICGNNVYAHVPDINDFTRGLAAILKDDGVVSLEFPHLLEMLDHCQFDTVYHEHYSYLSLTAVSAIFAAAGLRVFDVERLTTHGGSLRVLGCRATASHAETDAVAQCLAEEAARIPVHLEDGPASFQARADQVKNGLLSFLLKAKADGAKVVAYGAAAKGNTILNYAGVKPDLLEAVFDAAEAKQDMFMPGSHIPIFAPDRLPGFDPDYVLILPWNIADEVVAQMGPQVPASVRFVTAVPTLTERAR